MCNHVYLQHGIRLPHPEFLWFYENIDVAAPIAIGMHILLPILPSMHIRHHCVLFSLLHLRSNAQHPPLDIHSVLAPGRFHVVPWQRIADIVGGASRLIAADEHHNLWNICGATSRSSRRWFMLSSISVVISSSCKADGLSESL